MNYFCLRFSARIPLTSRLDAAIPKLGRPPPGLLSTANCLIKSDCDLGRVKQWVTNGSLFGDRCMEWRPFHSMNIP